jgi:ketosteroid isomerase-like protein
MIRGHYKALAAGDFPTFTADWRDDVIWHYHGNNENRGDYVGKAAVIQFFVSLASGSGGTFNVEPRTIAAAGDELVVQQIDISMTWDEESVSGVGVIVTRIVDGQVVEIWDIPESSIRSTKQAA